MLSVRDVARRLGVKPFTVYRLVELGELAHVRVCNAIRVPPEEVEAFIARKQRRGR